MPPPIASGQRACFGKANRRPRHAERGAQPRQPPQPRWKRTRPAKQMSSVARILVCASPNSSPAHAAHALRTAHALRRDVRVVPLTTECRVVPPTLWRFLQPRCHRFSAKWKKCGGRSRVRCARVFGARHRSRVRGHRHRKPIPGRQAGSLGLGGKPPGNVEPRHVPRQPRTRLRTRSIFAIVLVTLEYPILCFLLVCNQSEESSKYINYAFFGRA